MMIIGFTMYNEPEFIKIYHAYFYEDATVEIIRQYFNETRIHLNRTDKDDNEDIYQRILANACMYNRLDILNDFWPEFELNISSKNLQYEFNQAFMTRRFEAMNFLLDKDLSPNFSDPSVQAVLPFCSLDFIKKIKNKGYNIFDKKYQLLERCLNELPAKYEIIDYMLDCGCKIEEFTIQAFRSCLIINCPESQDKIDYILSKGIDINYNDSYALKGAIQSEMLEMVEHILLKGGNAYPQECSIYEVCAIRPHKAIFDLFIKHGVPLDTSNDNIIKICAQSNREDTLLCVQFLVSQGFNIDIAKEHGRSIVKDWCVEQFYNKINDNIPEKLIEAKKKKI